MENERVFTYIDTILRIIHINLNLTNQKNANKILDYVNSLETSRIAKSHFLQEIFDREFTSNPKTNHLFQHELHHYWQSLFYPFLYLVHIMEYMSIQQAANEIRSTGMESMPIDSIHLIPAYVTNMEYLTIEFILIWKDERLVAGGLSDMDIDSDYLHEKFTLNDFIEDPTSIYEYKITTSSPSGSDYSQWLRNPANNSYKKLYRFLEKIVGSENAFATLPMLIQLAFHTTEPASAFCNSFNHWYRTKKLKDEAFVPTFNDYLDCKLALDVYYPGQVIILNKRIKLIDLPTVFINEKLIDQLINYDFSTGQKLSYYPLADHFRKYHHARRMNPAMEGFLFDPRPNNLYLIKELMPFAIHHFLLGLNGRNSFIRIGNDFSNKRLYRDSMPFDHYLKEVIKITSTTLAVTTDYLNVLPHHCHHTDCPYYAFNKCRQWNAIPKEYATCGFPFWFGWFFEYRIDLSRKEYHLLQAFHM